MRCSLALAVSLAAVLMGCADASPRRHAATYAVDPMLRVQARIASVEEVDDYSPPAPPSPRLESLRRRVEELEQRAKALDMLVAEESRRR